MTPPRLRIVSQPLTMTWPETAEYAFRKGEQWLRTRLAEPHNYPEVRGFPKPDPVLRLFHRKQVDRWVANRFGEPQDDEADEYEARARGERQGPLSRLQGR